MLRRDSSRFAAGLEIQARRLLVDWLRNGVGKEGLVESLEDGAADADEFARWNPRMPAAVELADAHLDRLMLECVLAGTGAVKDAAGAGAEPLCALVAIELIRPHLGWYLCAGLLDTGQANIVDNTISALCDRIAPRGRALAEFALGIRPPGHDGGAERTK